MAEVLDKPVLARPDFTRRFYLKTDWSKSGMGAVLCQADPDDDIALKAELDEIKGGPCLFDKTLSAVSLRLRPIAFLSRRCTAKEQSWHSYTGEAATGYWAFLKWKRYLFGREFT